MKELQDKIIEVMSTENRGFFIDEIVTEIDDNYDTYTPKQFDTAIGSMLVKGLLRQNEEKDIFYLNHI